MDQALTKIDDRLTDKQAAFVVAYVENGGKTTDAAHEAGYSEKAAASAGTRNLAIPLIQQAILKQTLSRIGMAAPQAVATIMRLAEGARSEYVQLEAAKDLLDRAGFKPPDRVEHQIDGTLNLSFDVAPRPKVIDH